MGFGNFLKRKTGAYKLPESRLNKNEVLIILQRNMPFIVTLPITETVRRGPSHSVSRSQGGFRQTYYTPAERQTVFRTVDTNINCEPTRIRIQHAKKNGQHMFVKYSDIAIVGKIKNGVGIELQNGTQFKFVFGKEHIKAWKSMGFNPQFPLDVFYNFLLGEWETTFTKNKSNNTPQSKTDKSENTSQPKTDKPTNDWVICCNCEKKFKISAKKCPYCGLINDKTKNKTPSELAKKSRKICPNCGYENSNHLTKCWKCGGLLK